MSQAASDKGGTSSGTQQQVIRCINNLWQSRTEKNAFKVMVTYLSFFWQSMCSCHGLLQGYLRSYNKPSLRPPLPVLIVSSSSRSLYDRTWLTLLFGGCDRRSPCCVIESTWEYERVQVRAIRKCIPMTYFQPMKCRYWFFQKTCRFRERVPSKYYP